MSSEGHKIKSFLECLGGSRRDKYRQDIRAFLECAPLMYIAWGDKGVFVYSEELPEEFGLGSIKQPDDISRDFTPGSKEIFRNSLEKLKLGNHSESVVQTTNNQYLKLSLCKKNDSDRDLNILWIENVTEAYVEKKALKEKASQDKEDAVFFNETLKSIDTPVAAFCGRGKLLWCNDAYARLFSTDPEKALEEQLILSLKSIGLKKKIDLQDYVDGENQSEESLDAYTVIGGKRRRFEIEFTYLEEQDKTLAIFQDKTAAEEADASAKRTMAGYHALLENMQAAVALFDEHQRLSFFNAAYANLWGLEEAWLNGRPKFGEVLEKLRETRRLPEQADFRMYKQDWLDRFTKLLNPQTDMIVLPDGTVLRCQTIPNPSGGLMLIFEDVTSNLELESSYNTLIAVQRETLNNLSEGVVVYGSDGRIKLWNPTYADIWNLNPEDLEREPHLTQLGSKFQKFYTEDEWERRRETLLSILQNRDTETAVIRRNDGKILSFAAVPLPDGGSLFTYTDITDSMSMEQALRDKNRALETAERLKTEFLANVSYQLRTPLNAIIGFNEMLSGEFFGPLNDRQKDYTRDIGAAGVQLKQLIDDILDLTSIEAGILELHKTMVDVRDVLQPVTTLGEEWARGKQIALNFDVEEKAGQIYADKQRLKQVMMHLLRNAIKHTPEKGQITVRATRVTDMVVISVIDTGSGISDSDIERAFKPFEKITSGTGAEQTPGAGLGLSLVKNIIELHDADIRLASSDGKGTTVTLTFPDKSE